MILQADVAKLPLADKSVDLVFGSPPYCDARTYGIGAQRDCKTWVDWMLGVTEESLRVCCGPVVWVAAGVTRDRNYWPACEGLMWEWFKRNGSMYRPVYWHRVGIPGSGGDQWFRADVEYVMCFKREGKLPWTDNTACGHPPKWAPGGEMSHRLSNGARTNQWGHSIDSGATVTDGDFVRSAGCRPSHRDQWGSTGHNTGMQGRKTNGEFKTRKKVNRVKRNGDGTRSIEGDEVQMYAAPVIANPGNLIRTTVGGGAMGNSLAHESEAPFPEKLAEFFVRSLCPVGGIACDPFSGSGTTASVARRLGRRFIASDIRFNQCELSKRRLAHTQLELMPPSA